MPLEEDVRCVRRPPRRNVRGLPLSVTLERMYASRTSRPCATLPMRPKFSIMALLIVTGYVAIFCATVAEPSVGLVLLSLYMAVVGPLLVIDLLMSRRAKRKQHD